MESAATVLLRHRWDGVYGIEAAETTMFCAIVEAASWDLCFLF